jgi:Ala-tRNA(Pro) deacylase
MAIPKRIIQFLNKAKVKYEIIKHRTVYTAFDKAATLKIPQKMTGKTLLVKMDGKPAVVLLPANKNLDKQKFKKIAKVKEVDFIKEAWMKKNIKGIKVGAIPPFGSLWKFATFTDNGLMKNPKIVLNSGDYNFSIKLNPSHYKKLLPEAVRGNFSKPR